MDESAKIIERVRAIDNSIAVLIDTKGPEIRTSSFGKAFTVKESSLVQIKGNPQGESEEGLLYVNYENFVKDVPVGQRVLVDDGDVALTVIEKQKDALICKVENTGESNCAKG